MSVTAAELASIRSDWKAMVCDQDCTIKRSTDTHDAWGTSTQAWATVATTTAGLTSPTPGQLQTYADKIGSLKAWQVRLPYGTSVKEQDQLVIGTDTFIVQAILTPNSYAATVGVLAVEVS